MNGTEMLTLFHAGTCGLMRQVLRWSAVLAVAAGLLGLSGCGDVSGSATHNAQLRVVDASPDAGGLDIYASGTALTYNVGFGAVSSYVPFSPGTYTLNATMTGTQTVLGSTRTALLQNTQYTMLVGGNAAFGLQTLLLQDQAQPAPSGQVSLRFVDQATHAGPVDLYLIPQSSMFVTAKPLVTGLNFATATTVLPYLNVPSGAYMLYIVPTATVPKASTLPSYSGALVSYPGGSARTIVVLDQPLTAVPNLQVVIANDFDSALV